MPRSAFRQPVRRRSQSDSEGAARPFVRSPVVSTKVANDGTGISPANVRAEWRTADSLRFCLAGVEQNDRVLDIDVQTLAYAERVEQCAR